MVRAMFLCWLLFGISLALPAQEPAFVVFYNSGKASKTVAGKNVVLKKGDQLQLTDQLNVPEKAEVVLVCANFSAVQLKSKGVYPIKSLLAKCSQQQSSASSAYFKYVWHSFLHKHTSPEQDPRAYMKTYGAASRGKTLITRLNTDTINFYQGELTISWLPRQTAAIEVYDISAIGDPILNSKASKVIKIDSIVAKIKKPGDYYWAFTKESNAKAKYLKIWTKEAYTKAVAQIINSVVSTTEAEKAYLTGYMLEEKHFLAEAYKYYQKALRLQTTNEIYQETCAKFKP